MRVCWLRYDRLWLLPVLIGALAGPVLGATGVPPYQRNAKWVSIASSEIRQQSNGYWLYIDNVRTPAFTGVVYQPVEGERHIDSYTNDFRSLYGALDDRSLGGLSHGKSLELLGISAIRVYQLPVEDVADVAGVKGVFRRLHQMHRIKVLVCDWAGLYSAVDFRNPKALASIRDHLRTLATTYCEEPWILGWQVGNENNYHVRTGSLDHEIDWDLPRYYEVMDDFAGAIREEIRRRGLRQFVALGQGDLTEAEARLMASMKNIDAVGINCYRDDAAGFEQVIATARDFLPVPIYFAEIGKPANSPEAEGLQGGYLKQVFAVVLSHGAGHTGSGRVLGAFVHEVTDEGWKRYERDRQDDAYYGILGKSAEQSLHAFLREQQDFQAMVLPETDAPHDLINAAWNCINGSYAARHRPDYGNAMAYAGRAIDRYTPFALAQQQQLIAASSPYGAGASEKAWAITTVGTGYFIIGTCRMGQARVAPGEPARSGFLARAIRLWRGEHLSESRAVQDHVKEAQDAFEKLQKLFPYGHLRQADGRFRRFDRAIQSMFPELSPPYIDDSWRNAALFSLCCTTAILLVSRLFRNKDVACAKKSEPAMSKLARYVFVLALLGNLVFLFFFLAWWFHPVRLKFYIVHPVLFVALSAVGATGILFYFYVWHLLWNMRKPTWVEPLKHWKVAMVTTRVAEEPISLIKETLEAMDKVTFPHDTYLLDEEDSAMARWHCDHLDRGGRAVHFTRKGKEKYNCESGQFQARTKGGNLNAWLDQYKEKYDFVTFMDPDHKPTTRKFLDRILGYFADPDVAFVQAAQVFSNRDGGGSIARGATEQSYFFYGPIQMGLFAEGACVVNGSHSTFRMKDLFTDGQPNYAVHDADDILTSIRLHSRGKRGVYVPEVIAEGLAPASWDEYAGQQRRWAYSMFDLFFHYYRRELRGMPLRCKLTYLFFSSYYLMGVGFSLLLVIPFLSAFLGNPPVNAEISTFLCRYLPFLGLHFGILVLLGQRYLVPNGSRKGFWWRAGILWVGMWWGFLTAFVRAIPRRRVGDRQVTSKSREAQHGSLRAVLPHVLMAAAALGTSTWLLARPDRRETVWGMLIFLALIFFSQSGIALGVLRTPKVKTRAKTDEEIVDWYAIGKE